MASVNNITASLLYIDDNSNILCWEIITPFKSGQPYPPKELKLSINQTREIIRQKVGLLHMLGWAHGDLHIGNIGITNKDNNQDIVLFDFDSAYNIIKGKNEIWVLNWMNEGFGENSYDDFVEYDWTTWKTDFLF